MISIDRLKKTSLSSFDNSWYKPAPKYRILLWMITSTIFFRHAFAVSNGLKATLLRLFGAKIGKRINMKPGVTIKYPWYLEIGDDVWVGEQVWIDNLTSVKIGNNACISQGAMLLTGNHNYGSPKFDLVIKEIVIDEGVWIGAKAIVCPGVRCYSHSMLAVGSIATKNLKSYSIYQGNPALFIKERIIH